MLPKKIQSEAGVSNVVSTAKSMLPSRPHSQMDRHLAPTLRSGFVFRSRLRRFAERSVPSRMTSNPEQQAQTSGVET